MSKSETITIDDVGCMEISDLTDTTHTTYGDGDGYGDGY